LLKSERIELLNEIPDTVNVKPKVIDTRSNEDLTDREAEAEKVYSEEHSPTIKKFREINGEIKSLIDVNKKLEEQIEAFLKEKTE